MSLMTMLELNDGISKMSQRGIVIPMAAKGATRWDGINPTSTPASEKSSSEVIPGLFVDAPVAKKKRIMADAKPAIPKCVMAELNSFVSGRGDNTQSFYSYDETDDHMLHDSYVEGVRALTTGMSLGKGKFVKSGASITTVEFDNTQLIFNRTSKSHPDKRVPDCINAKTTNTVGHELCCYAYQLTGSPGALQMWLSPSQQLLFDETGETPTKAGPCLLCIRNGLHQLVLANGTGGNPMRMTGYPLIVPPFSIYVNQPGGYAAEHCITPEHSPIVATPFPINSGCLSVRANESGDQFYVDQGNLVFNVPTEVSN